MYAKDWLKNAHDVMNTIEATQMENVRKAATIMADTIEKGRWQFEHSPGKILQCVAAYL